MSLNIPINIESFEFFEDQLSEIEDIIAKL
jgi:hypothetical protein